MKRSVFLAVFVLLSTNIYAGTAQEMAYANGVQSANYWLHQVTRSDNAESECKTQFISVEKKIASSLKPYWMQGCIDTIKRQQAYLQQQADQRNRGW